MKTKRRTVRLPQALDQRISDIAEGYSKTESDIIREALEEYLDAKGKLETCYQLAKRIGFLGGGDVNLPKNLSVNKKHFKGFGI